MIEEEDKLKVKDVLSQLKGCELCVCESDGGFKVILKDGNAVWEGVGQNFWIAFDGAIIRRDEHRILETLRKYLRMLSPLIGSQPRALDSARKLSLPPDHSKRCQSLFRLVMQKYGSTECPEEFAAYVVATYLHGPRSEEAIEEIISQLEILFYRFVDYDL